MVRIRHSAQGAERYQFRLSWASKSYEFEKPPAGPGFSWNNALSFTGNGRGQAVTNGRDELPLLQVTVEIDRAGKLAIWFRTERGRPLMFTGQVLASESGKLKVDAMSEDRRLRGPMWITVDRKEQVSNVSLEATDGQDRLKLSWNRK